MNIFWLDRDLRKCAVYACDQHIVKMITEHTQQICTALYKLGVRKLPMRPTHSNHPCVIWLGEDFANLVCLIELNHAYHREYQERYGKHKVHKGYNKMLKALDMNPMRSIRRMYRLEGADGSGATLADLRTDPTRWITKPPQAMPEKLRSIRGGLRSVILAYRRFYSESKRKFARYRYSTVPSFMR